MHPTDEDVLKLVRELRVSLLTYDEDAANDAAGIASRITDDRPLWERVTPQRVSAALTQIKAEEVPAYEAPKELFNQAQLFSLPALKEIDASVLDLHCFAIHHAQGGLGSRGSYVLAGRREGAKEDDSGKLFIVKESHANFPAEVFASLVLQRMGLRAPNFYPLTVQEFRAFSWKLRTSARVTQPNTCSALHAGAAQEMGAVLMEFLPGQHLSEYDAASSGLTQAQLVDLGTCLAVDICLNCFDRTPIVWSHAGNATNLLLEKDGGLCLIDNAYNRIGNAEMRARHLEKAKLCAQACAAAAAPSSGNNNQYMDVVREFLLVSTERRIDLSAADMALVAGALHAANQRLAREHEAIFQDCQKKTLEMFERAWGAGKRQAILDCLQLDFCEACVIASTV